MKYLVTGLGNPGNEYAHTRHNIGFDVVYAFAAKHGGVWQENRLAWRAEVKWKGRLFVCILPNTYMNLSGKAVKYWLEKEKLGTENLLVVTDDLALPVEKMRLRTSGSDGGHNGLKDIEAMLNTRNYARLRFGIGNNFPKGLQSDFVLGRWRKEEEPLIRLKIDKCIEVIELFATQGPERAMAACNGFAAGTAESQ